MHKEPDALANARSVGHARARSAFPLGQCEYPGCPWPARDRHHVDDNPLNNDPSNVIRYCWKHHMLVDGRLERFRQHSFKAVRL
jgi:hypothetical protein